MYFVCTCMGGAQVCHRVGVEVRGQLPIVTSLLPGHPTQVWQWVPLEPSHCLVGPVHTLSWCTTPQPQITKLGFRKSQI